MAAARDYAREAKRLAPRDPDVSARLAQAEALLAVVVAMSNLAAGPAGPATSRRRLRRAIGPADYAVSTRTG